MRLPVRIMEATWRRPLSTRAQLAMLVEGLAGDPEPARRELRLEPAPFTVERLRPLVRRTELPASGAWALAAAATALVAANFALVRDRWLGMTAAMGALLLPALLFGAVRRRLRPTPGRVAAGLAAAGVLYGLTLAGTALLGAVWPGWTAAAAELYAWRGSHSTPFLLATLVPIVLSEELVWRGVLARLLIERRGWAGLVAAALLYAAAHATAASPLLLLAAFGCGLFWGWLLSATDDLTAPFVCHLVWDLLALFVRPL
jgi:hypothetical protein